MMEELEDRKWRSITVRFSDEQVLIIRAISDYLGCPDNFSAALRFAVARAAQVVEKLYRLEEEEEDDA
jgi:hypothetical protein